MDWNGLLVIQHEADGFDVAFKPLADGVGTDGRASVVADVESILGIGFDRSVALGGCLLVSAGKRENSGGCQPRDRGLRSALRTRNVSLPWWIESE